MSEEQSTQPTEQATRHEPTNPSPEKYHDVVFLVQRRIFGKPKNVEQAARELETKIRAMWSLPEQKEFEIGIVYPLPDRTIEQVVEAVKRRAEVTERTTAFREGISKLQGINEQAQAMPIMPSAQKVMDDLSTYNIGMGAAIDAPPSRQGSGPNVLVREPMRKELVEMNADGSLPGCECCRVARGRDDGGRSIVQVIHHHEKCQHESCYGGETSVPGIDTNEMRGKRDKEFELACGCCRYINNYKQDVVRTHKHEICQHPDCDMTDEHETFWQEDGEPVHHDEYYDQS